VRRGPIDARHLDRAVNGLRRIVRSESSALRDADVERAVKHSVAAAAVALAVAGGGGKGERETAR
jgi:hypothetical protein